MTLKYGTSITYDTLYCVLAYCSVYLSNILVNL